MSTTIEVLTAVAKNHKIELKGVKRVEWSFKVRDGLTIDLRVSDGEMEGGIVTHHGEKCRGRVSQASGWLDVREGMEEDLVLSFDNKFSWFTSKYIDLELTLELDESAAADLIWIPYVLMQAVRRCPASTAAPTEALKASLSTALEECTAVLEDSRQKWNA